MLKYTFLASLPYDCEPIAAFHDNDSADTIIQLPLHFFLGPVGL